MNEFKTLLDITVSLLNCFAIIIGGYIAYRKILKHKPLSVKVNVSQEITSRQLDHDNYLVAIKVIIENVGDTIIVPIKIYTQILQVLPNEPSFVNLLLSNNVPVRNTKTEYDWPKIKQIDYPTWNGDLRIFSGEIETLHGDFIISSKIKTIKVLSFLHCDPKDETTDWGAKSYYDIQ